MVDQAVARHFADAASRYSRLRGSGPLGRVRSREQTAVQELVDITPGATVLDAGCGDGATLEWLRDQGAHAIGIDLTWPMARICAMRGLTAAVQDIEEIGLRPVFDWVLCIGSLEFVPNPARALENLAACLSPTGTLVLLYPRKGPLGTLYALYHRTHGTTSISSAQTTSPRCFRVRVSNHPKAVATACCRACAPLFPPGRQTGEEAAPHL